MNHPQIFRGTGTALVTPFTADDQIDLLALRNLIDFQIGGGIEALVILGTTGENPTIEDYERDLLIETTIEYVNDRVPVVVGTGTNSTNRSVGYARRAFTAGASGQLVVAPYYNKPTQEGFVAHVTAMADAAELPIIVYNVPGRTGVNITAETTLRLEEAIPLVAGVKEASGNLQQISEILRHRSPDFAVYSGDDELALPIAALGGDGCISVISNALPNRFSALVRHAIAGRMEEARELQFALLPAMRACFAETNPIPIKHVLAVMDLIEPNLRLPLLPISANAASTVTRSFGDLLQRSSELLAHA